MKFNREKKALMAQLESLSEQPLEQQLEFDALKRKQAQLNTQIERLSERVEGLVRRELRWQC